MTYEKRGTVRVATDQSMANQLRKTGSRTQDATIELIQPVVAANPSVIAAAVAAASAAVDDEVTSRDLVEGSDVRVLQQIDLPGYSYAVVQVGTRNLVVSDLALNHRGELHDSALTRIGTRLGSRALGALGDLGYSWGVVNVDAQGNLRLGKLALDAGGDFAQVTIDRIREIAGSTSSVGSTSVYVADGDSLSAGDQGGGATYLGTLGSLRGAQSIVYSVPGEASADIRTRAGVPLRVNVPGGQIPASGSFTVTVSALNIQDGWRLGSANPAVGKFTGSLSGIPHTLVHDQTSGDFVFTRTTAGQAVKLPGGQAWFTSENAKYRSAFHTICPGRNNLDLTQITRDIDAIINWLGHDRYIVMAPPNNSSETLGSSAYETWATVKSGIQTRYGAKFRDQVTWMIDTAPEFMGLTLDADNLADRANRVIPRVLRADGVHYNANGYTAWGHYLDTVLPA
ncbi:hypothetical protein ACF044_10870 [Microbacterium sp. NPDC016588]